MSISAIALYDFNGTGDTNELVFKKDDVLELLTVEGDWLKAKLENRVGIVPRNYIQILQDVQQQTIPNNMNINNGMMSQGNIGGGISGIDVNVLRQFVASTNQLNEQQPISSGLMNTYPLVKAEYGKLSEKVTSLQSEQHKLLELHSKMVHANQLYDQLMEYQMISKMNFQQ